MALGLSQLVNGRSALLEDASQLLFCFGGESVKFFCQAARGLITIYLISISLFLCALNPEMYHLGRCFSEMLAGNPALH